MRNRSELSQVASAGFELKRIAVTQRVSGCYCASARCGRLWRYQTHDTAQRNPSKDGQRERMRREGHDDWAGRMKTFRAPAMLKTMSLDCEQRQPEREEARPVALGERAAKSGG
jgi:hypothetical protein